MVNTLGLCTLMSIFRLTLYTLPGILWVQDYEGDNDNACSLRIWKR